MVKKEPHACAVIVEIVVLRAWPARFRDHRAAAMMAAFKFAVAQQTLAVVRISFSICERGVCNVQYAPVPRAVRSEEHTSELQSLMRISYAVFCLTKKKV